jgi:hypothetical protein
MLCHLRTRIAWCSAALAGLSAISMLQAADSEPAAGTIRDKTLVA